MEIQNNKNNELEWWYEYLRLEDDWNSMKPDMRKKLVIRFQQCFDELARVGISERDIRDLIDKTDPPTVFDAILAVWALPDHKDDFVSRKGYLKYIKTYIKNKFMERHPTRAVTSYKEPEKKKKKGKPISLEKALQYNPMWVRLCSVCKKKINKTNTTGICTTCQRKGNGSEHNHEDG